MVRIGFILLAMIAGVLRAEDKPLQASLIASVDSVKPSGELMLAVHMKVAPHWHTYWINPGESGQAPKITPSGEGGMVFGEVQFPIPTKMQIDGGITYGYEDEVLLLIAVKMPADLAKRAEVNVNVDVAWMACKETCIEGHSKLSITLPVGGNPKPANAALFDKWQKQLPAVAGDKVAIDILDRIEQKGNALTIHWKAAAKKVDWFPVSGRAVSVENVAVKHDKNTSHITFKTTVYKPDQIKGGKIGSLLVYEDETGQRRGILIPLEVVKSGV